MTFSKITSLSQIISGRKYLIVVENGTTGYALDGSTTASSYAVNDVTITDGEITTDASKSFVFTKNGDYYNIQQVGGGQYLGLYNNATYASLAQDILIETWYEPYFMFSTNDLKSDGTPLRTYILDYADDAYNVSQWWPSGHMCLYRSVFSGLLDPEFTFTGNTTVDVNGIITTTETHNGAGQVTYTSSNESVAVVSSKGVITGVAPGTAVITANLSATDDYSEATAALSVTVNKITATATPNFTSRTIAVGDQTTLTLTTNSTGTKHFESQDEAVVTIDSYGTIVGVAQGSTTILYWIEGNDTYTAVNPAEVTVTVAAQAKLVPNVTVTPASLTMAVWEGKTLTIDLGSYDGTCKATLPEENGKTISLHDPEQSGSTVTYSITAEAAGETTITLTFPETETYNAMTIDVPVKVLDVWRYTLTVVDAPIQGVSVEIFGNVYTGSTVFNSSHHPISVNDVTVRSLASYTSAVTITGQHDDEIVVTYGLRNPDKGTFIRLKNYDSKTYATLAADGEALTMAAAGIDNIIYYDEEGRFLFYHNGQFVRATNRMASVADADQASVFTFVHGASDSDYSACYSIKSSDGKYLLGSVSGTTEGTSDGSDYAYWYVETLEELPVEILAAGYGYATLYCPVALDVPGGVVAFYVSSKSDSNPESGTSNVEYRLGLEPLVSLIPANTPVILVGMPGTTYQFALKYSNNDTAPTSTSGIVGHCAAQVTSAVAGTQTVYALQPAEGKEAVGFYPWTRSTISPFKCYFVDPNPDLGVSSYRLVFGNCAAAETYIEAIAETAVESAVIYDLRGQRVVGTPATLPSGLYIVGGRKIIVK